MLFCSRPREIYPVYSLEDNVSLDYHHHGRVISLHRNYLLG
jgi:hypothetical protein